MEVYEKVREYLYNNIGHLAAPDTPRFDLKKHIWKVPVLCKTEKGILIVGEFQLDEDGNFIHVPTKEEMAKIVEREFDNLPYLFYGKKEEINDIDIEVVTI
ncbi:MAG: hypothetical protein GY754_07285 [bacterium]|nr:hypothetical protein [bacterium]